MRSSRSNQITTPHTERTDLDQNSVIRRRSRANPPVTACVSSNVAFVKERKGKERKSIYIALFWPRWYTQSAQTWITQFYLQITPCLPFLRERSPDVTTTATEAADIQCYDSLFQCQRYVRAGWQSPCRRKPPCRSCSPCDYSWTYARPNAHRPPVVTPAITSEIT